MLNFRLNTKELERPSLIKGVRHFSNRKDAMLYAELKYGAKFKRISGGEIHPYYVSEQWNPETKKTLYITTSACEWVYDHRTLEVREQYEDKYGNYYDDLIEFCTYEDGYTYSYRYDREYNFIETV